MILPAAVLEEKEDEMNEMLELKKEFEPEICIAPRKVDARLLLAIMFVNVNALETAFQSIKTTMAPPPPEDKQLDKDIESNFTTEFEKVSNELK